MSVFSWPGVDTRGPGYDDMTIEKTAKNRHHRMISNSYDDMAIIRKTPRGEMVTAK